MIASIVAFTLLFVCTLCGCLMYVYFEGCDPYESGRILQQDQAIPFLVLKVFKDYPGVAGLFVSAAYSGMLR